MPLVSCPKCDLRLDVDRSRLERPVFCSACGGCIWQPAAPPMPQSAEPQFADPVFPVSHGQPDVSVPQPRLVFVEAENGETKRTVNVLAILLAILGLAFAVFVGLAINGRRGTSTEPDRKPRVSRPPDTRVATMQGDGVLTNPERKKPTDRPPSKKSPKLPVPPANVTAEKEGVTWNVDSLCNYLAERDIQFRQARRSQSTNPGWWLEGPNGRDMVLVVEFADAQTARESMRVDPPSQGNVGKVWGRFLIVGQDNDLHRRIAAALP